jgi:hypothetical protein
MKTLLRTTNDWMVVGLAAVIATGFLFYVSPPSARPYFDQQASAASSETTVFGNFQQPPRELLW